MDYAAQTLQFLALYEQGKSVIFWQSPTRPYAGRCGYNFLVHGQEGWLPIRNGYDSWEGEYPCIMEYRPEECRDRNYVCLGCCVEQDCVGERVKSRVKYHFEPFPDD